MAIAETRWNKNMTVGTQSVSETLLAANSALRNEISRLKRENIRLKLALEDSVTNFNAIRSRLEALLKPSSIATDWKTTPPISFAPSIETHADATDVGETRQDDIDHFLDVIEHIQFLELDIRLMSDGTLEADTPEGALRFEDFDHLQEVFSERWPDRIKRETGVLGADTCGERIEDTSETNLTTDLLSSPPSNPGRFHD